MKRTIVTMFVLFLCGVRLQAAQDTWHLETPFNGVLSGCGESIAYEGFVHHVLFISWRPDRYGYRITSGPRGDVRAVGLDSGNHYNIVGQTITSFESDKNGSSFGFINTFNVPGFYKVHQTMQLMFGENGTPKLSLETQKITCEQP